MARSREEKLAQISRGGRDSIENILPACRACNSAKGTLTAFEYRTRLSNKALFPRVNEG